jgi:NTP pyrophosphatase (non-canonical NTP hydrolase)
MSLEELQVKVKAVSDVYVGRYDIGRDDAWYLGKLSEELGELTRAYLHYSGRSRSGEDEAGANRQAMADECADLLGSVLLFAEWQGIDLAAALERKWFRYLDDDK